MHVVSHLDGNRGSVTGSILGAVLLTLMPEVLRFTENYKLLIFGVLLFAVMRFLPEGIAGLLRRLTAYPGVPPLSRVAPLETHTPVLSIHFRKGDTALRVFTTIATLGTPQDITLQEIRIECFFPADAATGETFRRWAVSS